VHARRRTLRAPLALLPLVLVATSPAVAAVTSVQDAPAGRPDATIDLATSAGVALVGGQWRYGDARIVEVTAKGPGPDLKPSGAPVRTYDIEPKAGGADFDDSGWPVIAPETLDARRSTGKVCFAWYRIALTIPERVGDLAMTGATVALEVVVDDYAEVWVNGALPAVLGDAGGQVVKGFNAPNRVLLTSDARPGERFQIAVFGMNGPISRSPDNFIWVKSATLDVYAPRTTAYAGGEVIRKSPELDAIVPPGATIERVATGFLFTEGPVWVRDGRYLLFSDPNDNLIYRWSPERGVSIFRTHSGYAGLDVGRYGQPGSNGLALDPEGRVTIDQHGERRVVRLERNGVVTVLADRYQGKRLNSPNDLVYARDGTLYFTDPPFGLPQGFDDPARELPFSGVYRLRRGELTLVTSELAGPNGIALAPDESALYVGNWDPRRKVVMRYPLRAGGTTGEGEVFADLTREPGEDAIDGVEVDRAGNVYVSGPGGLWIFSAAGTHLGTIVPPEHPHNLAFGDDDGKTLYLAAQTSVYRLRLGVEGARP
jgi:gluconolactonase